MTTAKTLFASLAVAFTAFTASPASADEDSTEYPAQDTAPQGDEQPAPAPAPRPRQCHKVVDHYETVTTWETVMVTVMQPVPQCFLVPSPFGPRQICRPVMVPVEVPQRVPHEEQVPVYQTVCE